MEYVITIKPKYWSYNQCLNDLLYQGCKYLGRANSGIELPDDLHCATAYNDGEKIIMVDLDKRVFYSTVILEDV